MTLRFPVSVVSSPLVPSSYSFKQQLSYLRFSQTAKQFQPPQRQQERDYIPNPDTVNQLKNIHPHQQLRAHDQDIPHRNVRTPCVRIVQHGIPKRHIDKRIHGHNQDE